MIQINHKVTISKVIYAALFSAAMLFATSSTFAQVKIGTSPTVIGPNSNLEVEAANNKKVVADKATGTLKVENKPLAAATDSVVTRDNMSGELHQISTSRLFSQQNVSVTVFSGVLTSNAIVPVWASFDPLAQRIPLQPRPGYSTGWDASTRRFTLPSDGFYQVEAGLVCRGTGTLSGTLLETRIWSSHDGGGSVVRGTYHITTTGSDWQSVVWSGQWPAGSTISLDGYTLPASGDPNAPTTGNCLKAYLNIVKVR